MIGTYRLVTAPAEEPASLVEAKAQLRVDDDSENARIAALIVAARQHLEDTLGRALVTQTVALDLEEFPGAAIRLPRAPVQSITHVKYYDAANVQQTWSADEYETELEDLPPRLQSRDGYDYPTTRTRTRAVTITYVCGYGAAAAVPMPLKLAILLLVADGFAHPEETVTGSISPRGAVAALISPYKVWM